MIPNVLAIAGSDPSGGAGIQADLKAISARGGYAMAALTALTAQNTQRVTAVDLVSPAMVRAQIEAVRADVRIDAIKIGMLATAEIIDTVVDALDGIKAPLVLDPVMVAKSGDRLLAPEALVALRDRLLPRATVITPNLPEAADLLGRPSARTRADMEAQAHALRALGVTAVLLKGGHLDGPNSPDLLVDADGVHWIDGVRHVTRNTHGTGCSLSAALATELAKGHPLPVAVAHAKTWLTGAIAHADQLSVGTGHGPVHHFHALWPGRQ